MIAIFSVLFTVAFISAVKVVFTVGLDADLSSYKAMLLDLKVVEVALWVVVAITWRSLGQVTTWFQSTSSHSISKNIVQRPDGLTTEVITSSTGQTVDHSAAQESLKRMQVAFTASVLCLAMFYFF